MRTTRRFGLTLAFCALLTTTIIFTPGCAPLAAITPPTATADAQQTKLATLNQIADRTEHVLRLMQDGQQMEIAAYRAGAIDAKVHREIQTALSEFRRDGKPLLQTLKDQAKPTATRDDAVQAFIDLGQKTIQRIIDASPPGKARDNVEYAFGAVRAAVAFIAPPQKKVGR